jgi:hypothetical protein
MTYLFDEGTSRQLVEAFRVLGEDVRHVLDLFDPGTEDEVWLEYAGKQGLVVVTRDKMVKYRPRQKEACARHKVAAFVLAGKAMGSWHQVQQLVRAWPTIKQITQDNPPPFFFRVDRYGNIVGPSLGGARAVAAH